MTQNSFRNILVASDIELAVKDLLVKWFPTYLREVERQQNWQKKGLETPTNYITRNALDIEKGETLPKVIIISPGLYQAPNHPESNGGHYNAAWQIAVGVASAAHNEELADQISKMYGAAVRAIMVQHQTLERDDVTGVTWLDESYDDLQMPGKLQLFKASASLFSIQVEDVVSRWAGPSIPTEVAVTDTEIDTVDVQIKIVN